MEPVAKDLIDGDELQLAHIADLKKQLEKMTAKQDSLEEECDVLAMENERLRTLCQQNGINPDFTIDSGKTKDTGIVTNIEEDEEFLVNAGGDDKYACSIGREIQNACGAGNALCVEYLHLTSSTDADTTTDTEGGCGEYVLCGGVDMTLRLYALSTGTLLYQHELAAPILAIDSVDALVACSMMDGSHAVIDLRVQNYSDLTKDFTPTVIQNQRDHTKYAVSIHWSPRSGDYLVTASHDKTVNLYQRETVPPAEESLSTSDCNHVAVTMSLKHKLDLKEVPEDVIFCYLPADFTSSSNSSNDESGVEQSSGEKVLSAGDVTQQQLHLVVPMRGAAHLLYINCDTFLHRKVSLNEHSWDTHCSFNVLHMSLSPSGKQLLVATDKDFHIILKIGTNKRLCLLAGHMCNDYGKPKTAWDMTGKYVYSNNQADHNVLVYAVNTGKIAATLVGHKGQIRDIKRHPGGVRAILTASYDHIVREWVREEATC